VPAPSLDPVPSRVCGVFGWYGAAPTGAGSPDLLARDDGRNVLGRDAMQVQVQLGGLLNRAMLRVWGRLSGPHRLQWGPHGAGRAWDARAAPPPCSDALRTGEA
jgi:hypothetical protein